VRVLKTAEIPTPSPVWITVDASEASPALESFLREVAPFGVILFGRHIKETSQVRELTACIRGAATFPPLLALDQEGGRVSRLSNLGYAFPSALELRGDLAAARALAAEMGAVSKDLGFQVDFAPVADLGPAVEGTGLEGRLFATDAATVTACCEAFLEGLIEAGVAGCLKHFPGLGGSVVDSHRDLPRIAGSLVGRAEHLSPYRALARSTPFVMTAHGVYEFLGEETPSSLHSRTYELLFGLGFSGTAVTDDLKMGAVSDIAPLDRLAAKALDAGAHVALWVSAQEETLRAMDTLRKNPDFGIHGAAIPYLATLG
jgi:beta-N-acetylhexosaminidase